MKAADPATIETPVGYVELDRARANATRVAAYARSHGLRWRPHVKTHKSLEVARIQLEAGAQGLTVATLREAEVMASLCDDVMLAYPPVGWTKLERLLSLPESVDIKVALDGVEVLTSLASAAVERGRTVGVLVELDVGLGRVGVQTADDVVRLAELAAGTEGVAFRGVLFYPGHIRMPRGEQTGHMRAVATRLHAALGALTAAGLHPEIVSGGSTPTLWNSHLVEGLTEIRSGSCIYFDREALHVGVADWADVAYTVLASVVSTAVPGRAVVDAGSKALAKESRGGDGFGILLDHPEVLVRSLSEEHGVLDLGATEWRPKIGERVRIVPNHVCASVNLQDGLLARDGDVHRLITLEARGRGPWIA
ncbi:MAG: alanine racemase [Gemmatimonadetes bacterium]|nr:alanine racemase [Gemmatimonadota bacterium]